MVILYSDLEGQAYAEFCASRTAMLTYFRDWIEAKPSKLSIDMELEGTVSALTQLKLLLSE